MLPLIVFTLLVQSLAGGSGKPHLESAEGSYKANSHPTYTSRIHQGTLAVHGQFKSAVNFYMKEQFSDEGALTYYNFDGYCSATIISRLWVLTAAHCLPCNFLYGMYNVGNRRFSNKEERLYINYLCDRVACKGLRVEKYIAHPKAVKTFYWCNSIDNRFEVDIALLKMKNEINFGDHYDSMPLMSGPMQCAMTDCIAMGYGDQNTWQSNSNEQLYYVYVNAGNLDYCKYVMKTPLFGLTMGKEHYICANNLRNPPAMPCEGDSGAGLFCPDLFGDLVSVGVYLGSGGECGNGSLHTLYRYISVGFVERWIKNETNDTSIVFKTLT